MKIKSLYFLLSVSFCLIIPANAFVEKDIAVIRILNKAAGKVHEISVPVGQSFEHEKLKLFVHSCKQTDPFDPINFFMFININNSTDAEIFSGWMNRNDPGDNPLQDADYDIWLVSCK